jgi:hypothetical protein
MEKRAFLLISEEMNHFVDLLHTKPYRNIIRRGVTVLGAAAAGGGKITPKRTVVAHSLSSAMRAGSHGAAS